MPLYTVTLTNVTRGWSYTATEGTVPSSADAVQLADDMTYGYGFTDSLIPSSTMDPLQLSARLYCKQASDIPRVDNGDELRMDLRLGTVGKYLVRTPPLFVNAVEAETDLRGTYTTTVLLRAADDTAQLDAQNPQPRAQTSNGIPAPQFRFRRLLTEIGQQIGRSVGVPTWWGTDAQALAGASVNPSQTEFNRTGISTWAESARALFTRALNDIQPGFINHVLVPSYLKSAYPAGYGTSDEATYFGDPATTTADPASTLRLLAVPAGRRTRAQAWPLKFAVRSGVLTLQPVPLPGTDGHDPIGIDAAWCDLPVKMRRAREHVVNALTFNSWQQKVTATSSTTTVITQQDGHWVTTDVRAGEQATMRTLPVNVQLGDTPDSTYISGQTPQPQPGPYVANRTKVWFSDDSQRAAWVYDDFTVHASRVPADLVDTVLPRLAPRLPGETDGDGHVLKHLTIYRPAAAARPPVDQPGLVVGFVVSGQLRIVRGDILYTFRLTPGLPIPMDASYVDTTLAPSVTIAQVNAAAYGNTLIANLDPLIRIADLDNVGS